MKMTIHQFKIPIAQLEKTILALGYLELENYTLFENEHSPKSNFLDQDGFPMGEEFFLETDEKINELKALGFEYEVIKERPIVQVDFNEEIIVGRFAINPKTSLRGSVSDRGNLELDRHASSFVSCTSADRSLAMTDLYFESAMAFGTGRHQTTQGCLLALEYFQDKGIHSVLDLGCGSGILGIAAYKLLAPERVDMSDIDPVAVEIVKENCVKNSAPLPVYVSDGFADLPNRQYDLVIANILLNPLCSLASEIMARSLRYVVLSGIIESQLEDLLSAFSDMVVCERIQLDEWVTLILRWD